MRFQTQEKRADMFNEESFGDGQDLQECQFSLNQYQAFLERLIATLSSEARTIVKFVGLPDGTFGLSTVLAATGQADLYHVELIGGVCPHCIILGTLGDMTRSQLDIDKTVANQAGAKYLELLRQGRLPELYIMHRKTLQGAGGHILRQMFNTAWGVNCTPAHEQPALMPFTGNCSRHAYNGR
jgi:hypothetical protein